MYSIGQFSTITGLTIKSIRFYGEKGLLVPSWVDQASGYRYFTDHDLERARLVATLRDMTFSIEDIQRILVDLGDDDKVADFLARKRTQLVEEARRLKSVITSIDQMIEHQRAQDRMPPGGDIERVDQAPMLVASIRKRGRYADAGAAFSMLARHCGGNTCGPAFSLYYDGEYREDDADVEWCMPVRKGQPKGDITVRTVDGGPMFSLVHCGAYDHIGHAYARLFAHLRALHLEPALPMREVYVKGPGMILRGNPNNYVTHVMVRSS